jgi:hypothetical protein
MELSRADANDAEPETVMAQLTPRGRELVSAPGRAPISMTSSPATARAIFDRAETERFHKFPFGLGE